jgi:voltage-gated potassium channel
MKIPLQIRWLLALIGLLLVGGTIGYRLIEGQTWSWLDALYMTAITLTTVGFLEVHELSSAGRIFTIFLAVGGVSTFLFLLSELLRYILTGELRRELGRGIMQRVLADLKQHIIVCGYGRVGKLVCEQLSNQNRKFVVIDNNSTVLDPLIDTDIPWIHGDATTDEILKKAGAERATGLVASLASDADNLYIVLSARLLNDKLMIVARCENADAVEKLRRVGANQVISPYVIGGMRIAQAVTRPTVADFIDQYTVSSHTDFQIEEITVRDRSRLIDRTLAELRLPQELNLTLVAIRDSQGKFTPMPSGDHVLSAGQIMVVVGPRTQLDELERLSNG